MDALKGPEPTESAFQNVISGHLSTLPTPRVNATPHEVLKKDLVLKTGLDTRSTHCESSRSAISNASSSENCEPEPTVAPAWLCTTGNMLITPNIGILTSQWTSPSRTNGNKEKGVFSFIFYEVSSPTGRVLTCDEFLKQQGYSSGKSQSTKLTNGHGYLSSSPRKRETPGYDSPTKTSFCTDADVSICFENSKLQGLPPMKRHIPTSRSTSDLKVQETIIPDKEMTGSTLPRFGKTSIERVTIEPLPPIAGAMSVFGQKIKRGRSVNSGAQDFSELYKNKHLKRVSRSIRKESLPVAVEKVDIETPKESTRRISERLAAVARKAKKGEVSQHTPQEQLPTPEMQLPTPKVRLATEVKPASNTLQQLVKKVAIPQSSPTLSSSRAPRKRRKFNRTGFPNSKKKKRLSPTVAGQLTATVTEIVKSVSENENMAANKLKKWKSSEDLGCDPEISAKPEAKVLLSMKLGNKLLSTSILTTDILCLAEEQFLNDQMIDFWLEYVISGLSETNRARTHVFSNYFYKCLTTRPKRRSCTPWENDAKLTAAEKRHCRVKKWTKNVDIFSKDFIIIPINENAHWFLAIICFPGIIGICSMEDGTLLPNVKNAREREKKKMPEDMEEEPYVDPDRDEEVGCPEGEMQFETDEDDLTETESDDCRKEGSIPNLELIPNTNVRESKPRVTQPCIVTFDSMPNESRDRVYATLREYIRVEHKVRKSVERTFTRNEMPGYKAVVPEQPNHYDCGIYVLQYVESFFSKPLKSFLLPLAHLTHWFEDSIVYTKRKEIYEKICDLIKTENPENVPYIPALKFNPPHSSPEPSVSEEREPQPGSSKSVIQNTTKRPHTGDYSGSKTKTPCHFN